MKSKYKTISEWKKADPKAYKSAHTRGLLREICEQCGWEYKQRKPMGYWTKENCIFEAKKYKTRSEWQRNSSASYKLAIKNGWLGECCKHMVNLRKPNGYWTKGNCIAEGKKYKTRHEWYINSHTSYSNARKNGWLDEGCKHMIK